MAPQLGRWHPSARPPVSHRRLDLEPSHQRAARSSAAQKGCRVLHRRLNCSVAPSVYKVTARVTCEFCVPTRRGSQFSETRSVMAVATMWSILAHPDLTVPIPTLPPQKPLFPASAARRRHGGGPEPRGRGHDSAGGPPEAETRDSHKKTKSTALQLTLTWSSVILSNPNFGDAKGNAKHQSICNLGRDPLSRRSSGGAKQEQRAPPTTSVPLSVSGAYRPGAEALQSRRSGIPQTKQRPLPQHFCTRRTADGRPPTRNS